MPEFFDIIAKGAMRLSAPVIQVINDSSFSVLQFDHVTDERGGIICDPDSNSITVASSGLYTVNQGIDATFPGAEMVELIAFVNGTEYSPNYLVLQGRANQKPVSLFWQSTVSLSAGDAVTMQARNGESGSFDLHLFRMYMALIKEH
jgi:hypothetical protein